jgi:glutaredoxin 3
MDIKVYSTPTCPYCHMAKDYLKSKQVDFTAIDVSADRAGLDEMVKVSKQMGVPVIVVDGKVVVGFDKTKIDSLIVK